MRLQKIAYKNLNPKQKENYNFQKVSSLLADYGFQTIRLSDDWQSADFIAQHIDGELFLKVQLKARLTISKKYCNKDLWICFRKNEIWYLYPHDEVMNWLLIHEKSNVANTISWTKGEYTFSKISKLRKEYLEQFIL